MPAFGASRISQRSSSLFVILHFNKQNVLLILSLQIVHLICKMVDNILYNFCVFSVIRVDYDFRLFCIIDMM